MTILHMVPPSSGMLQQHIELVDQKHEDGHVRLRQDVRALEVKFDALESRHNALEALAERRAAKPVDLEDVRVSWKMAASMIAAIVGLAASQWAAMGIMRSDLNDIKASWTTSMDSQAAKIDALQKAYTTMLQEQALERVRLEETRRDLAKTEGLMTGRKR